MTFDIFILQVIEIYFNTPTFDKITRDSKTTNFDKISLIGGTLGLLSGKLKYRIPPHSVTYVTLFETSKPVTLTRT